MRFSAVIVFALAVLDLPSAFALVVNAPHSTRRSGFRPRLTMSADGPGGFNPFARDAQAPRAAALLTALAPAAANAAGGPPAVISYSNLLSEIKSGDVEQVFFSADEKNVIIKTVQGASQTTAVLPSVQGQLVDMLLKAKVPFSVAAAEDGRGFENALQIAGNALNFLFPAALLFFLLRPRQGGGGPMGGGPMDVMNMGKTRTEVQMEPDTGVTFADVAGCDGSKLELQEVVEFLSNPEKFTTVGAKAPRGVVMEGPPGTGKTLLARAVAGEAGVPFLSASGSEFVEMFVGVGASRIRDLFGKAKKAAPCILFIDEIDAIGKSRMGAGNMGGNDEREQTLNQILTEMDGFEGNSGVVVIAATNRADVLDSALLRPGRFDRRVPVDLPDREGRFEILKVHARSKPLDETVKLEEVAARTTGFSGASLSNLLNEAAIVTARRDKTAISISEIEFALDRLTVGMEKRTGMSNEKRQRLVAVHEAGHAVMATLTPGFDEVGKITIVPRSNGAGGFTLFVPSDERQDSGMYSKKFLEGQLAVALGGRVAEEIFFGSSEVTTGASNDLQRVADVARRMVTQWGFAGESLGFTAWENPSNSGFSAPKMASEDTQLRIDQEVEAIVNKAYQVCTNALTENKELMEKLTDKLIEEETIDNAALMTLFKEHATGDTAEKIKAELAAAV